MQAVILAAGLGKRLRPIMHRIPKSMIRLGGRNLIERNLSVLPKEIDEIIIVVGHLQEKIREYFGESWKNKKIKYLVQKKLLGTAHALFLCRKILKGRFLVLMGDNIYWQSDLQKCLHYNLTILTKEAKGNFISVIVNKNGWFKALQAVKSEGLMNAGAYVLDKNIFKYKKVRLPNNEFGLPQTLAVMARDCPIKVVKARRWLQINTRKDLNYANKNLKIKT